MGAVSERQKELLRLVSPAKMGDAELADSIAERLWRDFEDGNQLALFECCKLWKEYELPYRSLPAWVVNWQGEIFAEYAAQYQERKPGKKAPSLDSIALPKMAIRTRLARLQKAKMLVAYSDHFVGLVLEQRESVEEWARTDAAEEGKPGLVGPNLFGIPAQKPVEVLNSQDSLTDDFNVVLAEIFSASGNSRQATLRRVMRLRELAAKYPDR